MAIDKLEEGYYEAVTELVETAVDTQLLLANQLPLWSFPRFLALFTVEIEVRALDAMDAYAPGGSNEGEEVFLQRSLDLLEGANSIIGAACGEE